MARRIQEAGQSYGKILVVAGGFHIRSAVWRLTAALWMAREQEALRLAGTFRDEYQAVGNLQLYLLGLQGVEFDGGYAGTIYYFWEIPKHRYYAYRDLHPQFYEGRRRPGPMEALLWELPGTPRQEIEILRGWQEQRKQEGEGGSFT